MKSTRTAAPKTAMPTIATFPTDTAPAFVDTGEGELALAEAEELDDATLDEPDVAAEEVFDVPDEAADETVDPEAEDDVEDATDVDEDVCSAEEVVPLATTLLEEEEAGAELELELDPALGTAATTPPDTDPLDWVFVPDAADL